MRGQPNLLPLFVLLIGISSNPSAASWPLWLPLVERVSSDKSINLLTVLNEMHDPFSPIEGPRSDQTQRCQHDSRTPVAGSPKSALLPNQSVLTDALSLVGVFRIKNELQAVVKTGKEKLLTVSTGERVGMTEFVVTYISPQQLALARFNKLNLACTDKTEWILEF